MRMKRRQFHSTCKISLNINILRKITNVIGLIHVVILLLIICQLITLVFNTNYLSVLLLTCCLLGSAFSVYLTGLASLSRQDQTKTSV